MSTGLSIFSLSNSIASAASSLLPCDTAKNITVKLIVDKEFSGSGILINETKGKYFVLTNSHLISEKKISYKIQTPDGKQHSAIVLVDSKKTIISKKLSSQNKALNNLDDLALLRFSSKVKYSIAQVVSEKDVIAPRETVYSAGFPAKDELNNRKNETDFLCDRNGGDISISLSKPMRGGYQLGYFINVINGMSGGALVNKKGQLVGINGLRNYPIISNYIYKDGKQIEIYQNGKQIENLTDWMDKSSWAIPIETIENFISKNAKTIKLSRNLSLMSSEKPSFVSQEKPQSGVTAGGKPNIITQKNLPSTSPSLITDIKPIANPQGKPQNGATVNKKTSVNPQKSPMSTSTPTKINPSLIPQKNPQNGVRMDIKPNVVPNEKPLNQRISPDKKDLQSTVIKYRNYKN